MKLYFSFNAEAHDFWPLYEAIKAYYPIGLRYFYPSIYFEYEGYKKLNEILVDNIHNEKNFKERFDNFTRKLQDQLGMEVRGTTYGQEPAYSFDLILEKTELPGLIKIKKLSAAVSLLGNFYSIYGVDETILIEDPQPYPNQYVAVNAVTPSPYMEFEQPFLQIKKVIQERYPGHKQVPFAILNTYLNGLYTKFDEINESTIYNALFNQQLNSNHVYKIRGDQYYAYDEWLKEGLSGDETNAEVIVMPPLPLF